MDYIVEFIGNFWNLAAQMAPYLLLGLAVAGVLRAYISDAFVERHLGNGNLRGIIKASLLGVPLPLCSCGVIPVAASLYRQGASRGATVSFLISTPQTGVDSIMVTWSLMGPFFAIYRVIISFFSGIFGGALVSAFIHGVSPTVPVNRSKARSVPRWQAFKKTALVDLPRDIGKALLLGLAIGALISMGMEPGQLSGDLAGWAGMLLALIIGLPFYVCATGSVPIAAALVTAGLSPGAALVFLMTGPATNIATITTIGATMGRRTAAIYVGTIGVISLLSGILFDLLFFEVAAMKGGMEMHEPMIGFFDGMAALVLLGLILPTLLPKKEGCGCNAPESKGSYQSSVKKFRIHITGMHCGGCASAIERTLRGLEGVDEVEVDFQSSLAKVRGVCHSAALLEAIKGMGYEARL